MNNKIELVLPFPPSLNRLYRPFRGRMVKTKECREYHQRVDEVLILMGFTKRNLKEILSVEVLACPPDRRRRDLDNLLKVLFDAMQKVGIYEDDSQIKKINMVMDHIPSKNPFVIVKIEMIKDYEINRSENESLILKYERICKKISKKEQS